MDGDDFIGSYLATLDGRTEPVSVSRVPDAVVSGGSGCTVAPSAINSGASVLLLDSPSSAAAVGTIEPGRTDAEIEAFLATSPAGPPPWFAVSALLQTEDGPAESLVALAPGDFTVVCIEPGTEGATVTGRAALHVGVGSS